MIVLSTITLIRKDKMNIILKLFLLLTIFTHTINAMQLNLTIEEQQWIKDNPTIKVQSMADSTPYNFIQDGKPSGYALANIKLIASKVGLKVEMVQGNSWNESMELLKKGEIDVMPNMVKTKPRVEHYAFTSAYTPIMNVMYVKEGDFHPKSLDDLDGKTLGIPKGFSEISLLQKHYPNIKLHFTKNGTEAFKLLALGEVDATSYSLGAGNKIILKNALLNVVPAFEVKDKIFQKSLHMATNKNNTILRDILQKGLDTRTAKEKDNLRTKWLLNKFNSSKTNQIEFTPKEKEWIANNPKVSIAMMPDFSPFSHIVNDKNVGFEHDILSLISQQSGLQFDKKYDIWNKNLNAFKNKQVDIISSISYKKQRESFTLFTSPYYEIPIMIFTRNDFDNYKDITSLKGKKVGILKDVFYANELKQIDDLELVVYETYDEITKALVFGKIDALIQNLPNISYLIKKNAYTNLKLVDELKLPDVNREDLRFGINKDKPLLKSIIQKSLDSITPEKFVEVTNKWLDVRQNSNSDKQTLKLTVKEINYLSTKQNIKMCVDPDWLPFEAIDKKGKYKGIGADIVKIVSQKINKPILLVPTTSWMQTMNSFLNKKCDIIPVASKTPSRLKTMNFTNPYIKKSLVVATREDKFFIQDSSELLNKKIGVVKGYSFIELLKQKQPNINIITVKNTIEGLKKVQNGQLYGFVDTLPTIAYMLQKEGMIDLKVAGRLEFDVELSIASQKDQPLLNSIMQKTLDDIKKEQIDSIVGKWISIKVEQSFDYKVLIYIVMVFLVIFAFMVYRHNSIKKMNKELEKISITDALTHIYNRRYFNEIFPKVIKSAKRKDELVSFVIMDIDHFKQYNDTYGHQVGDEALLKVATSLKNSVNRADDYCFRLGGEEFGVVFKVDSKEKALEFANSIRENIENLCIEHSGNSASPYVTVSMGLICKNAHNIKDADEIYKQGDDLLYEAKESGRNKVILSVD